MAYGATDRDRILQAAMENAWTVRPRGRVHVYKKGGSTITVGYDEDGAIVRAIVNGTDVLRRGPLGAVVSAMRGRVSG